MEMDELENAITYHLHYITTYTPNHIVELSGSFWGALLVEDVIDDND